ncbi:MAG: glycerol-3-phosphate acyltransferase [Candidatus Heimdallarchaeota archaeon]|nr:glycerol-3-phosphate acyltransferase [Candidatus Heimdallarchaeota archaeon]
MIGLKILWLILGCLGGYLLGSIPFSVWIGKIVFGKDVRNYNVRNAGGMNAILTLGPAVGIPILFLDFFKGTVTIALIDHIFSLDYFVSLEGINIWHSLACFLGAICCILGHSYSIWLKFDGGQGLGVYTGIVIYINPIVFGFYNIFIIAIMLTKKVNVRVGTLIVILLQSVLIMFIPIDPPWSLMPFNSFPWEPNFLAVKLGLLLFVMGMTMLARTMHSKLKKSKSAAWRIGENAEQKYS